LSATSGASQSAAILAPFTSPLVVTATDGYSNGISGLSVTFAAPASGASATFAATCSANQFAYSCTQTTGTNGQATSSAFTANGTSGNYNISASATGLTAVTYAEANNKGSQTITFTSTAPTGATVGGSNYTATATGGASGNPVTFTSGSSSVCTSSGTNGSVFTFVGVGTCVVDANQASSSNYNAATQVTQSFLVEGSPTAVALTNGNGKVGAADTATITFNDALQASTICSSWTGTGSKTLSNATITFTNSGSNDTFAASSTSCTGGGNFGIVATGSNYVSGTVTFANSTIAWNSTTEQLTFTLGATGTPSGSILSGVASGFPGYTASGSVTDTSGNAISTTTFTSTTKSGF
jgi:hypothetical protein